MKDVGLSPLPAHHPRTSARPGEAPVFLVGAARSGTTLLYKAMALHPDVSWPSNWVARFPAVPQLAALNRVARALPGRRSHVWFGRHGDNAYVYGARRPLRDRLLPTPHEAEPLYAHAGIPEFPAGDAELDRAVAERLRWDFSAISRWDGRRQVLSKRIANDRRIPWLCEVFPQARFIEIVRDGRAVAASLAAVDWWEANTVWWYGGTPGDWRSTGGHPWELCARNWVEEVRTIRRGFAAVDAARVLSVRYEDVVRDPMTSLEKAMEFCGLDAAAPAWRRGMGEVRFPNQNERWRATLSEEDRAVVESVQHEELERYGYC
ncbi:MAG TPA: sulfotransferase [Nocardioidaceae bacterium]|nr:sulfotransferase [Nocardioidaceae bacterium]